MQFKCNNYMIVNIQVLLRYDFPKVRFNCKPWSSIYRPETAVPHWLTERHKQKYEWRYTVLFRLTINDFRFILSRRSEWGDIFLSLIIISTLQPTRSTETEFDRISGHNSMETIMNIAKNCNLSSKGQTTRKEIHFYPFPRRNCVMSRRLMSLLGGLCGAFRPWGYN